MSYWVRDGGTWKDGQGNLGGRDGNSWGAGDSWVRDGGTWKAITTTAGSTATGLEAPTIQSVTDSGSGELAVSWTDNSTGEAQWQAGRCSGSTTCTPSTTIIFTEPGSSPPSDTGGTFSSTDTGLDEDEVYGYRLRAASSGATPALTGPWSQTEYGRTGMLAPSGLSISDVCAGARLSWTDESSANTRYRIERCEGAACSSFSLVDHTTGTANSYVDSSASVGSTYRWRVRAESTDTGTESDWTSSTGVEVTDAPVLQFVIWNGSTCGFDMEWSDCSTDETQFDIHRCSGSSCNPYASPPIDNVVADTTSYTDTDPAANSGDYTYGIKKRGGTHGDQNSNTMTGSAGAC